MRRTLPLLALLFFISLSTQVFGQSLVIETLESYNKMGMTEFQNEVKKMNFKLSDKTQSADFVLNEYEHPTYKFKLSKFEYIKDKSQNRIEFEFNNLHDYNKYMEALRRGGYKEIEKGKTITKEPYVDYYKGKQHIRMVLPKENQSVPYSILVFK